MAADNSKFTDWIQAHVNPLAVKIGNQRYLAAIRDGMTAIIPLSIIGGFSILLASPPIPAGMKPTNFFYAFLLAWQSWASANSSMLMTPYNLSIGLLGLFVVVSTTYQLSKHYEMNILTNLVSAVFLFLIAAAPSTTVKAIQYLPQSDIGARGMFGAIVIAILAVEVNRYFINHKFTIRLPEQVPSGVAAPFEVLVPLVVSTIVIVLADGAAMHFLNLHLVAVVYLLMSPLANLSGTLPVILFLAVLSRTLWFFGMHGDNMVGTIVTPITTLNIALNLKQYQAGHAMTHIFAGAFYQVWGAWMVYPAFLLAMLLFAKSARLKSLAKLAPVGTMFNINEPLTFGIPTVLNPMFYLAIVSCTVLNITVAYVATVLHLIGVFYIFTPWTTPGILQVFLAAMDWRNVVLYLILFTVDFLICTPFLRAYDKQLLQEENGELEAA